MAYSTITNGEIDLDSPITTSLMTKLRDNPEAIALGLSGATKIANAAFTDGTINGGKLIDSTTSGAKLTDNSVADSKLQTVGLSKGGTGATTAAGARTNLGLGALSTLSSVTQTEISAGAIHRAGLSTSTGESSTTSTTYDRITLPGGDYGFYPQFRILSGGYISVQFPNADNLGENYVTKIELKTLDTSETAYVQQRYINSSPPFDIGDGEIPLFVFAKVDKDSNVKTVYCAEVPPWAYNGPTNISYDRIDKRGIKYQNTYKKELIGVCDETGRKIYKNKFVGECELTHEIKNADMNLIPHPFLSKKNNNETIVLLDACETLELLELKNSGESINELLHSGYIKLSNDALKRKCPRDVMQVGFNWRFNK